MKRLLFSLLFVVLAFGIGQNAWADCYEVQSLGANGYDVVAYQTQNAAVPGTTKFYTYLDGKTYLFANDKDKTLFMANPKKYLPAYGGFCAMAMALGKKHPSDPTAFRVVNGKLYLNKKDARPKWLKDIPGNIEKADTNWKKLDDVDPAKAN